MIGGVNAGQCLPLLSIHAELQGVFQRLPESSHNLAVAPDITTSDEHAALEGGIKGSEANFAVGAAQPAGELTGDARRLKVLFELPRQPFLLRVCAASGKAGSGRAVQNPSQNSYGVLTPAKCLSRCQLPGWIQ
jgi:hypothetical protein